MRTMQKRISRSLILGLIIVTLLISTAIASPIKKNINVTYNSVNITVNGERVATDNLLYEGTTYVPLRAVSEMLGKEVGWNEDTKTASINDTSLEVKRNGGRNSKENLSKTKKNIDITYNSINIEVNDEKVSADNLLYEGTTYVPLRAVSEMLGKEVAWDGNTNTASINDKDFKEENKTINNNQIKPSEPSPKPEKNLPVQNKAEEVYRTKTGTKYHRANCSSLRRSKIPISLEDAKKRYEPCKICNP